MNPRSEVGQREWRGGCGAEEAGGGREGGGGVTGRESELAVRAHGADAQARLLRRQHVHFVIHHQAWR